MTDLIGQQLSSSGRLIVERTLTDDAGRGTASLVGVLVPTWNGLLVFRGLNRGVEETYPNASDSTLLVVLRFVLLPIYYVLPPVETSIRDVLAGTVVAALGRAALQTALRTYAANAGQYGGYDVIGAILSFVTVLYFARIVVLLDAAVNAVRDGAGPRS